jgi:uncharacterized membrane protein
MTPNVHLWIELGSLLASLALFWLYLRELRQDAQQASPRTAAGVMAPLRLAWLETVIREGRDLLCVQTLRNWTMSTSLMASASMLGGLAAVGFALSHNDLPVAIGSLGSWLPLSATPSAALFALKVLCLAGTLFVSFFHFSSALRYYNHVVACVVGTTDVERRIRVARHLMRRGVMHQSTGARSLYACAAVALWVVGAPWLLLGSLGMILLLRKLDAFEPG